MAFAAEPGAAAFDGVDSEASCEADAATLAYDIALTNVSIDADKLNISSEKSNITGRVVGGTIELDGWYKDPWGYVNSVQGSLTESGGRFTGLETCYNTQLAASAPTSQMTRHFCNVELSQIQ